MPGTDIYLKLGGYVRWQISAGQVDTHVSDELLTFGPDLMTAVAALSGARDWAHDRIVLQSRL